MTMPGHALVRDVASSYDRCIRAPGADVIDVGRARAQHHRYVELLARRGLEVIRLEADARFPDSCFVEDTAVVARGIAALCRSGAVSRRGEEEAVATVLSGRFDIHRIREPGTVDGGDVLRLGNRAWAGHTARTNREGIEQLAAILGPAGVEVVPVEGLGVLHLKSACTPLGDDAVLACPADIDTSLFAGAAIVEVPEEERYAANCLCVGDAVLIADGFPETRRRLEAAGYETLAIDVSEFRKGQGSLTCLSILF